MDEIKDFWQQSKADYESRYNSTFLTDYNKSLPYFEKMQELLLDLQKEDKNNVDVACLLASVRMELRDSYDTCAKLLLDFLDKNKDCLSESDKARIYTNIGYYIDFESSAPKHLLKAEELDSQYYETYEGLGLYYFSEYERDNGKKYLEKAIKYFEKARELSNNYVNHFNYAAGLYENKEYQRAKAKLYLSQVKYGQDENYSLSTDEISEYQVYDSYYVLDEYNTFLDNCKDIICNYYTDDWKHYYYTLWIKNLKDDFYNLVNSTISRLEESIKEAEIDEDYSSPEEKEEYIKSYKEDLVKYRAMIKDIEDGCKKPEITLNLYPEYECFLIDCLRHKFID